MDLKTRLMFLREGQDHVIHFRDLKSGHFHPEHSIKYISPTAKLISE